MTKEIQDYGLEAYIATRVRTDLSGHKYLCCYWTNCNTVFFDFFLSVFLPFFEVYCQGHSTLLSVTCQRRPTAC